jgi:hypothetical protein
MAEAVQWAVCFAHQVTQGAETVTAISPQKRRSLAYAAWHGVVVGGRRTVPGGAGPRSAARGQLRDLRRRAAGPRDRAGTVARCRESVAAARDERPTLLPEFFDRILQRAQGQVEALEQHDVPVLGNLRDLLPDPLDYTS